MNQIVKQRNGYVLSQNHSIKGIDPTLFLQVIFKLLHVELRVGDEHALALLLLEPHHSCQEEVVGRHLMGDLGKAY